MGWKKQTIVFTQVKSKHIIWSFDLSIDYVDLTENIYEVVC